MFRNRSVIEIMIITFTGVVALTLVGLGAMIIVVEARNPEADTGLIANTLMSLISGILGALLGLLAGKSEAISSQTPPLDQRPSEWEPE